MYFDEEIVLDVRLNTLNKYVDYFVIVESEFTHSGNKRDLKFNHKKFEKFKNKIIYKVFNKPPNNLENINDNDSEEVKGNKYIMNAIKRENGQRKHNEYNKIIEATKKEAKKIVENNKKKLEQDIESKKQKFNKEIENELIAVEKITCFVF